MRHNVKKLYLGLPRDQRRNLINGLATSLILEEKIQTTEAKAKALQPIVEKLINTSKESNKRLAIGKVNTVIQSDLVARKLMEEVSKRYQGKNSGYTRITSIGFRSGDAAPLVQIELV